MQAAFLFVLRVFNIRVENHVEKPESIDVNVSSLDVSADCTHIVAERQ